jgi:hypothetical protein
VVRLDVRACVVLVASEVLVVASEVLVVDVEVAVAVASAEEAGAVDAVSNL